MPTHLQCLSSTTEMCSVALVNWKWVHVLSKCIHVLTFIGAVPMPSPAGRLRNQRWMAQTVLAQETQDFVEAADVQVLPFHRGVTLKWRLSLITIGWFSQVGYLASHALGPLGSFWSCFSNICVMLKSYTRQITDSTKVWIEQPMLPFHPSHPSLS